MRPGPLAHRSRSHRQLLAEMAADARWRSHATARPWDPTRPGPEAGDPDGDPRAGGTEAGGPAAGDPRAGATEAGDLGRGLLDCFALGLHVLWAYQEAWADEGFLATAHLPASVRRLLELIGYHPDPGYAAGGFQHFRAKEGAVATLPPRFRVTAKAVGDREAAAYETLTALVVAAARNELRAFLPTAGPSVPTTGAVATAIGLGAPSVPPPGEAGGASALLDQVLDRLSAARAGSLAQRDAAAARQRALRLADVLAELRDAGAAEACGEAFERLCAELCEAQDRANEVVVGGPVGPLSESQELLLARLRAMAANQPSAIEAFQKALARQAGESVEEWSRRLDLITGFLDALVAGILQEARDQVVRLHGPRALTVLDRALAGGAAGGPAAGGRPGPSLGVAPPGTDTVFLLPSPAAATHLDLLRPGDWLAVGEDVEEVGTDGVARTVRRYREVVQVLRARDEVPAGLREPATRVTFTPPLARRYQLDRTVLVGNVAPVTHGTTVVDEQVVRAGAPAVVELGSGPLSWRRVTAPDAPDGRVPEVEVAVAGQPWSRLADLRAAGPAATVFAVEVTPQGGARLRVGDGRRGARVPEQATVSVTYRTGIGEVGNRGAGEVDSVAGASPAVATTFNPLPVTGGVDPEPPDVSKLRAGAGIHALDRAVSAADVRSLALSFGGVRHAAVRRHPRRRDRLDVFVVGEGGRLLDEGDRASLHRYLVARMPPGSSVSVDNAARVPVVMRLVVRVQAGHDPLAVVAAARARLGVDTPAGHPPGLLAPGRPGLGEALDLSDVYAALTGIPHLASAFVALLHRAGETPARHDRVDVGPTGVAVWAPAVAGSEPVSIAWEEARDL